MTTTVTIKHEGPAHHNILVERTNPITGELYNDVELQAGEWVSISLYDTQGVRVSEVVKA